ncbi:MAG: hypothetical protein R3F19_24170 [Verrucomicrobiales bacterium]
MLKSWLSSPPTAESALSKKQTSSGDKICSIADIDAAIIRKGGWQDVLGYKPLAFTGKGS